MKISDLNINARDLDEAAGRLGVIAGLAGRAGEALSKYAASRGAEKLAANELRASDGQLYRWMGAAWGKVNPATGKVGQMANKQVGAELNAIAGKTAGGAGRAAAVGTEELLDKVPTNGWQKFVDRAGAIMTIVNTLQMTTAVYRYWSNVSYYEKQMQAGKITETEYRANRQAEMSVLIGKFSAAMVGSSVVKGGTGFFSNVFRGSKYTAPIADMIDGLGRAGAAYWIHEVNTNPDVIESIAGLFCSEMLDPIIGGTALAIMDSPGYYSRKLLQILHLAKAEDTKKPDAGSKVDQAATTPQAAPTATPAPTAATTGTPSKPSANGAMTQMAPDADRPFNVKFN